MADSDYTVAVVLQASDEGMSTTLKNTGDNIKKVGDEAQKTKVDLMATLVAFESLTSGLNQLTGGMRKYSAALQQTGHLTDEQAEAFNKQIATVELLTGPMETLIAIQKILTVATLGSATAKTADASASITAAGANTILGFSIYFVLGALFIIVGILIILYVAWQNQEVIIEKLNVGLAAAAGLYSMLAIQMRNTAQAGREVAESIGDGLEVLKPFFAGSEGGPGVIAAGGGSFV